MAEVTIFLKDNADSDVVDVNVDWGGKIENTETATPAQRLGAIMFAWLDRVEQTADALNDEGGDDDQPEAA